jgi:hypothetical protein
MRAGGGRPALRDAIARLERLALSLDPDKTRKPGRDRMRQNSRR